MEQPIAIRYGERSGRRVEVIPPNTLYQHDVHPWLLASPDAMVWPRSDESDLPDSEGALQVKTAGVFSVAPSGERISTRRLWLEHGPPLQYQLQLQHELMVTGWDWGCLICLVGGQELLGPFDYVRDDNLIDGLFGGLAVFWAKVVDRTAPDIDSAYSTAKAIARMYGAGNGDTVDLTPADEAMADERDELGRQMKAMKEKRDLLKNQLAARMGEASIGILPGGGHLTYRTITKKPYLISPKPYREMRRVKAGR